MSDPTPVPTPPATPAAPPQGDPAANQPETDWQAKFEAQQKVNRDLETKFNGLRDSQTAQSEALAKALGLKPEETNDVAALAATVAAMQEQFASTSHDNTVLLVARENGITDQSDIDLLKAIKDDATMRATAGRIAAAAEPSARPPRPNPDQGRAPVPASGGPAADFAAFIKNSLGT